MIVLKHLPWRVCNKIVFVCFLLFRYSAPVVTASMLIAEAAPAEMKTFLMNIQSEIKTFLSFNY